MTSLTAEALLNTEYGPAQYEVRVSTTGLLIRKLEP